MKIKLKEIEIDTSVAREIASKIVETEMESMGDDEYIGEFNIEIEERGTILKGEVEILVGCSGKLIQRGKIKQFSFDTPPEFVLNEQYINNMDLRCYVDGEEIEFNCNEIAKQIEKYTNK